MATDSNNPASGSNNSAIDSNNSACSSKNTKRDGVRRHPESELVRRCQFIADMMGVRYWRVNQRDSRFAGVTPGVPDMILGRNGRALFVEFKVGRNKPTDAQIDFLSVCGGVVVYSEEDFVRVLRDWLDYIDDHVTGFGCEDEQKDS